MLSIILMSGKVGVTAIGPDLQGAVDVVIKQGVRRERWTGKQ